MNELYAAPMEGLTGWRWRQVHRQIFGGADLYFTPFLSPNANCNFQTKEKEEIDPVLNEGLPLVPQILTNQPEYFLWAAEECRRRGYFHVNLNLGCPSGTVTGKKKGSGLLREEPLLRALLDGIFAGLPGEMQVSVKTRTGWDNDENWPRLLELFGDYPIARLIVHPRLRTQFYKGEADRVLFEWTAGHTALPLCYNGDLTTPEELCAMSARYPDCPLMVGRGLMADPALLRRAKGGPAATVEELHSFHDRLYGLYRRDFSGDVPVLHHMREMWNHLSQPFQDTDELLRRVRKARSCHEYEQAVEIFFAFAQLK